MPIKKGPVKKWGKPVFEDEEEPKSLRDNAVHPTCVIAAEDITELADIGKGFYATVKFGYWQRPGKKTKENVAIKCIKEETVRDHLAEILTEANTMVKLEHDNIIKLYGICLVTRENEHCTVKLVTEYAPFGSLLAVVQDTDEQYRSFFCQITKLWEFANQIARGMEYLHSKNLIHFDLAARNVLVVATNKVRISDFGLARVLCHDQKKILLEKPIAIAWCAPELFKNQHATKECDIWSYGVLLWEMMSFGKQPWEGLSNKQIMEQAENYPDKRLSQPQACSDAIFEIMRDSWIQEPGDRPSFTKIIESLKKGKPEAASAKNTYWTSRPKELSFQKGTKITLIDRYGMNKYLCQNDKAELGYVNEENISFKVAPVEVVLNKPKISSPFHLRHTNEDAILKEHNDTGLFPVEVNKLVELANKNLLENIPVEPNQLSSQVPKVQTGEIGDQATYTPMTGASEGVVEYKEPKTIKHGPSKRTSNPPPIPKRDGSLHQKASSQPHSNTLQARKSRPPVPKPRKNRPKSTDDVKDQDSKLEWVITIHSPCQDDKKGSEPEGKESFLPRHEDDMKGDTSSGYDVKDQGPRELETNEAIPSHQTEPNSGKKNNVELSNSIDLMSFDQSIEDLQALRKQQDLTPPPLPKRAIKPKSVCNEPFPSLPRPPVQTPANKTNDPAKEIPYNQSELKGGLLIDLETDLLTTYDDDDASPPLPQKDFLSRRSRDLELFLPPSFETPVRPGISIPNTSQVCFAPPGVPSFQSPKSPAFSRPLPEIPLPEGVKDGTSTKQRSKSESSLEKETAYGDEINEGIATIQSEFPEVSKDACYARILEYKGDTDRILKVLQVSKLTSIPEDKAQYHLGHCGWNVERTVNWILDKFN